MGPLVRLVGSGIGLASEAIAARKANKAEKEKAQAQASSNTSGLAPGPSSRGPSPDPPAYSTLDPSSADYGLVEAEDEHHARQLIDKGHAVPHDQPEQEHHENLEDMDDDEACVSWDFYQSIAFTRHRVVFEPMSLSYVDEDLLNT